VSALVQFSAPMRLKSTAVKHWLLHNLYRHPQVMQTTVHAQGLVRDLFAVYMTHPQHMPASFAQQTDLPRAVADYIAGMTDRHAQREHERLH
jgi:dGTPase